MLDEPVPENMSSSLVKLRLGSNSLGGPIPSASFEPLQNLMYLELENNGFTGKIPPQIGHCRKLALLNLAKNKLNGNLPEELLDLTQLQVLELQLNKLGGGIPDQIGQLIMLSVLNISWNSLNGTIPSSISNCANLFSLSLQNNDLTGSIPDGINNMSSLFELQLGANKLYCMIPDMPPKLPLRAFLTGLPTLSRLVLSDNQLSGVVPYFSRPVMVDWSGNPELGTRNEDENGGKDIDDKFWFYISMGLGYPIGFWVVCGSLVIKRSWRRAYFRFIDEMKDRVYVFIYSSDNM
ncbi:hypothetical protein GQ457_05G035720 [Hibiscus cannabinus]